MPLVLVFSFFLLVGMVVFVVVMSVVWLQKKREAEERKKLNELPVEEVRQRWLIDAQRDPRWKGELSGLSLDRLREGESILVEFEARALKLGGGYDDLNTRIPAEFIPIGEIQVPRAWVFCRAEGGSVWEFVGDEFDFEWEERRYSTLFHYLAWVGQRHPARKTG